MRCEVEGTRRAAGNGMVWVDMGGVMRLGPRGVTRISAFLEADLVNHAEADESGKRKRDANCEQIHIDGKPVAGGR